VGKSASARCQRFRHEYEVRRPTEFSGIRKRRLAARHDYKLLVEINEPEPQVNDVNVQVAGCRQQPWPSGYL
jgi:hypothetical protein